VEKYWRKGADVAQAVPVFDASLSLSLHVGQPQVAAARRKFFCRKTSVTRMRSLFRKRQELPGEESRRR